MKPVPAIVLAAGASRRLGTPKQLVRLGGETLLERIVRVALEAGLAPIYGVVSLDLPIEPGPAGMIPVINYEAAEGMASSIRAGLRALEEHNPAALGVVLLACDQPAVTPAHLRRLAGGDGEVLTSAYAGRKGVPAYFPYTIFDALLALQGDSGARNLLRDAKALPLQGGELDVDTIEDLGVAQQLYST